MWRLLLMMGVLAPLTATAGEVRRVAVIPFDNLSHVSAARTIVMDAVGLALAGRGYEVIEGASVGRELDVRRIRYLDSVTTTQAKEILLALEADALVVGTILAYDTTDQTDPRVAVVTRIVGPSGMLLWSGAASASAAATERSFGRGKVRTIEALTRRAVGELYATLPSGDRLGAADVPDVPIRHERTAGVRVFRSTEAAPAPLAISVLPFENFTKDRSVTRIFEAIVLHQLSRHEGIKFAEPAEVRRSFPSGKGYLPSRVPTADLREASSSIGTRFVLSGAVFAYTDSHFDEHGDTPLVDLYLCLTDSETGRIHWSGTHRRVGRDYEGLLQRGAILDPVSLAHVVVDELVGAFTLP